MTTISGRNSALVSGIPVMVTSGGGLGLTLTAGGQWTLTGRGAAVRLTAGTVAVDATVTGTAAGTFTAAGGDRYIFRQDSASGEITLKQPVAGITALPMGTIAPALAPTGAATLTCGTDSLRIESVAVVLELRRLPPSAPSTPPSATTLGVPPAR